MVSTGVKCVKYLLFVFNFIFFLTGCGTIGLGVWLNVERNEWEGIAEYHYISIANTFIIIGAVIVIIAFLGCCGAITENKRMMLIFFIFLLAVFLVELVSGILAYAWRGKIHDNLLIELNNRIPERYYKETSLASAMNILQKEFECCGVNGFDDWKTEAEDSDGKKNAYVHRSCCKHPDTDGYKAGCTTLEYTRANAKNVRSTFSQQGCFEKIKELLAESTLYLGVVGIVFAIFQVVGLFFSMVMFCALHKADQTV